MKKLLLILLTTCSFTAYGQQFSFQMFFTNAIGKKDTITLGYAVGATDSIDAAFGEVNIIGVPRDTAFDVRITNEWRNRNRLGGAGSYHTKKQIIESRNLKIQAIDIYTKHWPVTVTWDNALFNDSYRNGSVFTSITPGGWWDTRSPSNLYRQILSVRGSATFTSNNSRLLNTNYSYTQGSDTIPVFWQAFGNLSLLSTPVEESAAQAVKVFPNPFSNQLDFTAAENEQMTVSLYDFLGQQVLQQTFTNATTLNTQQLADGIYFFKLCNNKGIVKNGKILKQ
jgi:hypothetical protein